MRLHEYGIEYPLYHDWVNAKAMVIWRSIKVHGNTYKYRWDKQRKVWMVRWFPLTQHKTVIPISGDTQSSYEEWCKQLSDIILKWSTEG